MTSAPSVSILMTAYNREKFIAEAIESVLKCGYKNFELIIVDDGSKDATVAIARSYTIKDKRIKLYVNEKNLGDYPNRNKAANYSTAKYLVNVDSDDTMFPGVLEQWVEAMEINKTDFGIFAKMGNIKPVVLTSVQAIQKHFFDKPILLFGPGATIVTKKYFMQMNGFPEKYGPANDMYHHLKMASGTNTLVFPFPLINYRIHDQQELNNTYGYLYNNYNYYRDALAEIKMPLSKSQLKYLAKKNKRRFVTNVYKYWKSTKNIANTKQAVQKANFKLRDFITAIFQ